MNEATLLKWLTRYAQFGAVYGGIRSYVWLSKLNQTTYTKDGYKTHPVTTSSSLFYSSMSTVTSIIFWPLISLHDLSYYEKNKCGVRELTPGFPFYELKWKDEVK